MTHAKPDFLAILQTLAQHHVEEAARDRDKAMLPILRRTLEEKLKT